MALSTQYVSVWTVIGKKSVTYLVNKNDIWFYKKKFCKNH